MTHEYNAPDTSDGKDYETRTLYSVPVAAQASGPTQLGYTLSDVHEAYSRGKAEGRAGGQDREDAERWRMLLCMAGPYARFKDINVRTPTLVVMQRIPSEKKVTAYTKGSLVEFIDAARAAAKGGA